MVWLIGWTRPGASAGPARVTSMRSAARPASSSTECSTVRRASMAAATPSLSGVAARHRACLRASATGACPAVLHERVIRRFLPSARPDRGSAPDGDVAAAAACDPRLQRFARNRSASCISLRPCTRATGQPLRQPLTHPSSGRKLVTRPLQSPPLVRRETHERRADREGRARRRRQAGLERACAPARPATSNASGSRAARSERILRSSSMPALLMPSMNCE